MNRIYRSKKDRMVAGVCGGIAEYFKIDPTIVRLLWVLVTIFSGFIFGIIAYIIAAIIIPEKE
ncbi:PspC domain-containing protein [Candidatus Woesearchaeota archaeon]|nr:PspC domain-containing protein [Candidatus Woesearchaeota archaeon]